MEYRYIYYILLCMLIYIYRYIFYIYRYCCGCVCEDATPDLHPWRVLRQSTTSVLNKPWNV